MAVLDILLWWVGDRYWNCSIYWLYGPAGAGKSAIAQTVAECCARDGKLAASFFFLRDKLGCSTGKNLFPTIVYQLTITIPGTKKPIGMAVHGDPSILHKSIDVQLEKLIVEPCRKMASQSTLVIIDGLDEYEGNDMQHRILSLIGRTLASYQLPLCFIIASRPEPHIRDAFDHPIFQHITGHLSLDDSFLPDRDIHIFLQSKFADICEKNRDIMASVPQPWPSNSIINLLVQKSSRQFIYASTVLKFIDDEYSHPTDQLKIVLGLTGFHLTAFVDLDRLYHQILSVNPNTSHLLRILGVVLTVCFGLPSRDIKSLLALESGDVSLTMR